MEVCEFFSVTWAVVPSGTSISRTAVFDSGDFLDKETLIMPYFVSNDVEARLRHPI